MGSRRYNWPVALMIEMYNSGNTCDEIATLIAGRVTDQQGQPWLAKGKIVGKVLRRNGCVMRKTGAPGRRNVFWTGGRIVDKHGYVLVKQNDHPHANNSGYVREHRLVVEKALGRHLEPHEIVHHKDDNPANNHPDNLELFSSNADHLRATRTGKVPEWSDEGRARIRAALESRKAAARLRREVREREAS